ncbi:TlpA family protein disulfide reductase [Aeromicrobium sp. CTD01-1L150]|uniref:TlpA family protein disulfide reductase n=1 Tax=Aeromicrobium sp. CTD01-1L150 TaxID=3341830 RepID=UPI0035BFFC71
MSGLLVLLVALVATVLLALAWTRHNGRFTKTPTAASVAGDGATGAEGPVDRELLTPADIGADLGDRVTLVQFSSAFCSPCRATRTLLTDVVADHPEVAHVEVDAESHLDLVRRLDVRRTPTVLVLDADGVVVGRASGLPRREQVETVLEGLTAR